MNNEYGDVRRKVQSRRKRKENKKLHLKKYRPQNNVLLAVACLISSVFMQCYYVLLAADFFVVVLDRFGKGKFLSSYYFCL